MPAAAGQDMFKWILDQTGGIYVIFKDYWWAFLIIFVGVAAMFYMRKQKQYPLRAVIYERRGDDVFTHFSDKLGRVTEHGILKWKFLHSKDTLPPANYEYVTKCSLGTGCVHLIKYGAGQYKVIDIRQIFTDGKFRVIDVDDWNFKCLESRAALERRKFVDDLLLKYAPLIGLALVVVLFIISVYFSYNYLKDIATTSCSAHNANIEAANPPAVAPANPLNLLNPNA